MIEDSVQNWNRSPNGEIEIEQVVAWAVAAAPGEALLRLEILDELGREAWTQLSIPADQAAELAKCLAWMAQRALGNDQQGQA